MAVDQLMGVVVISIFLPALSQIELLIRLEHWIFTDFPEKLGKTCFITHLQKLCCRRHC